MDKRVWERVREILPIVRGLPLADRHAYLEEACSGDEHLRREVESLLAADLNRVAFLEAPPLRLLDSAPSFEGRTIGAYRIIRELGHGGMGTVYLAARADQEFERQVAIKLLRPIHSIPEIEWRFQQEIQILANLNHPNIAKLYEVGRTEERIPYFIMEPVDGLPITRFCIERNLSIEERLRIFQKICGAVEYAHQNLVVHRDLKPSNILVTPTGEPKLLDFGIAKLLQSADSPDPATVTRLRFFTPDYASPEQVSGQHITTASDVYSLGVLLYELLTGNLPYSLKGHTEEEVRRIVCEQEPEIPSRTSIQKLPNSKEMGLSSGEARRDRKSRKLRRQLQGDLDKIVMTALRKEPSRRYRSVEQLAGDVYAYLEGFPVSARGDSWRYKTAKFLRRNRLASSLTTAVVILSLGFGVLMALQQRQTVQERDRAQRVANLLVQVFNTVDPSTEPINALDVLNRGARTVRMELSSQPELRADLLQTLGDVYTSWGSYDQADSLLKEALAIRRQTLEPESPEEAETLYSLGVVAYHQRQFEKAETLLQDSLRIRTEALGHDAPELADNLIALGLLYKEQGDMSRTERLYLKALDLRRRALGPDHPKVGILMHNLGAFYRDSGNYTASEQTTNEALKILRGHFGPEHPEVALVLNGLAGLRKRQGRFSEAEAAYREALKIRRKVWGSSHPDVAGSLNNLGLFLVSENRLTEAEPLLIESLELQRRLKGEKHPDTGAAMNNLGLCVEKQGKSQEALRYYRSALAVWKSAYPGPHQSIASAYNNIGNILMNLGKDAEAATNFRIALQIDIEVLGEDHPKVASKKNNLGALLMQMGDLSEAERFLNEALAIRQRKLGQEHPDVAMTLHNLAHLRWKQEQLQEAEQLFREVLAIKKKSSSPASLARTQVDLADLLATEGRAAEAEPLIRGGVETFRTTLALDDWRLAQAESVLGDVLGRQGHSDEAATLLSDSHRRLKELLGAQAKVTRTAYGRFKGFCDDPEVKKPALCKAIR